LCIHKSIVQGKAFFEKGRMIKKSKIKSKKTVNCLQKIEKVFFICYDFMEM